MWELGRFGFHNRGDDIQVVRVHPAAVDNNGGDVV